MLIFGKCGECIVLKRGIRAYSLDSTLSNSRRTRGWLPSSPARTRFAPSPTGALHLGSLRTALFNWLLARATGGQFILRIEDTDRKRLVEGAEQAITNDLLWAGLEWDEGPSSGGMHGPYRQSERTALYASLVNELLQAEKAYRCFCSPTRPEYRAKARQSEPITLGCDRRCLHLSKDEVDQRSAEAQQHTIRLRMPDLSPGFHDMVHGLVSPKTDLVADSNLLAKDPILIKSNGMPTYHLANVIDDHYMKITHVIRASEWLSSTSKHIAVYQAFGWSPPIFAHVGLLQDMEGQKLSKRNSRIAFDISTLRKSGVLPEALLNFLALLGWSHPHRDEMCSLKGLVESFDMNFTTNDSKVNHEKMQYLQRRHAQVAADCDNANLTLMKNSICAAVEAEFSGNKRYGQDHPESLMKLVTNLLKMHAECFTSTENFVRRFQALLFHLPPPQWQESPNDLDVSDVNELYKRLKSNADHDSWTNVKLEDTLNTTINRLHSAKVPRPIHSNEHSTKKSVLRFLRWALVAGSPGPAIVATMSLLGRVETITRLREACQAYESTFLSRDS